MPRRGFLLKTAQRDVQYTYMQKDVWNKREGQAAARHNVGPGD